MNAPAKFGFETEARELSDNEHFELAKEIELMRADSTYTWQDRVWWERDNKWSDDPAEYFANHHEHFLEQARELFAEVAA